MNFIGFLHYSNAPGELIDWVIEAEREMYCPTGLEAAKSLVAACPTRYSAAVRAWIASLCDHQLHDAERAMDALLLGLIQPYADDLTVIIVSTNLN